jgi:hypothetical protein
MYSTTSISILQGHFHTCMYAMYIYVDVYKCTYYSIPRKRHNIQNMRDLVDCCQHLLT